ncbi:site-specific integrase [Azospirillum soli]|uniref:site-specific integrase n=1 Tax=Azospirillum soli TaxID=1304799 RepID=UPI001AE7D928|nr:tyrosine-type recombinase/integrase [Azospirillum soli]MBP2314220.1 site-specific recombinase XerD [Azospirillum soli]
MPAVPPPIAIPFAHLPHLSATDLARLRAALATRPLAAATRRALLGDARLFVRWCAQTGHRALPASRATVTAFLAAAAAAGRAPATLRRYRSSLAWWHAAGGYANPCAATVLSAPLPDPALTDAGLAALRRFLDVAQRGLAPATLRAVRADARVFAAWCGARSLSWLPATPETVRAFIQDAGATRKPATLARYLASIALLHRAAEHRNPCDHWSVALERRGHARERGSARRQAAPLTDAVLGPILDRLTPDGERRLRPIDLRDRALLLVGRDTLARADELVALRWADLQPVDPDAPEAWPGEGTIRIRRSKTDPEGEGAEAWLSTEAMAALAAWRAVAPRWPDPATGAAMREGTFVLSHLRRGAPGERMSPAAVRRVILRRTGEADPQATGFGGHSLRVGAAQDLLAAGVDLAGLMQAGRWTSPQMPARYTERLRAARGAVARVRRARQDALGKAGL